MAEESEDSRPSKRPRTEEAKEAHTVARDKDFYQPTGDCIIRVENTLFKIHRYILERDSEVFATMLTLPQGDAPAEGASDTAPIHLEGDSAAGFRSLLGYLYAPAITIQATKIPVDELQDVLSAAHLAFKYEMRGWQEWSALVISGLVTKESNAFSSSDFAGVLDVTCIMRNAPLCLNTVRAWLARIRTGDLPAADAMEAAERNVYFRKPFLAGLYDLQLLLALPAHLPNHSLFHAVQLPLPDLAPIHVHRILSGYLSMSFSWSQFRQRPELLVLPKHPTCQQHDLCKSVFNAQWESALMSAERLPVTHLHCRLQTVLRAFQSPPFAHLRAANLPEWLIICRYDPRTPNDYLVKTLNTLPPPGVHFFGAEWTTD